MHSLTIWFGPTATVCQLLFKTEEGLKAAEQKSVQNTARETYFVMTDDYGQNISVERKHIVATLLEDLDQSQLGQVERGLHNARSQAKAQSRAMADPMLKAAMMAQGPAVLSGGMPPRFNG